VREGEEKKAMESSERALTVREGEQRKAIERSKRPCAWVNRTFAGAHGERELMIWNFGRFVHEKNLKQI